MTHSLSRLAELYELVKSISLNWKDINGGCRFDKT